MSAWSPARSVAQWCGTRSTCPRSCASACARRPGWRSALARPRRSRCRSSPRSCRSAAPACRGARPCTRTTAAMTIDRVAGLVVAAGGSRRLGQPKQLLPYRGRTLLDHTLDTARACGFDQLLCAVGGGSEDVLAAVDLRGIEIVENPHYGDGCSSSIAAALTAVDPRSDALVLLLGDQPGVR